MTTEPTQSAAASPATQRALAAFKIERLNCAQSVLRGFQPQLAIPEEAIHRAKDLGKGRADGGRCGSLHAALQLAADDQTQRRIVEGFVAKAESELCKEIRQKRRLTCAQCVELAADLLSQNRISIQGDPKCP